MKEKIKPFFNCEKINGKSIFFSVNGSRNSVQNVNNVMAGNFKIQSILEFQDFSVIFRKIELFVIRIPIFHADFLFTGNNEGIEAYTSNIYSRRVLSGEFQVVNQHLLRDLTERDLWDDDMKNKLIAHNGSIQNIEEIPEDIKRLYKTVWEISQKTVLKMAADRGAFIDQSQSLNVHIADPNFAKLSSMHFYGWQSGLKTGMYYLRTKAAASAIQFTVDKTKLKAANPTKETKAEATAENENGENEKEDLEAVQKKNEENMAALMCSLQNKDDCLMCGS